MAPGVGFLETSLQVLTNLLLQIGVVVEEVGDLRQEGVEVDALGVESDSIIMLSEIRSQQNRRGRRKKIGGEVTIAIMHLSRESLQARIAQLQEEIVSLGAALQPGILTQQYNVCGKAGCRCKADPPQRHGPYYQLSFTRQGKSRTQFVKPADLRLVRQQIRNYQRLRTMVDQWISWGMELARLELERERLARTISSPKKRGEARIS